MSTQPPPPSDHRGRSRRRAFATTIVSLTAAAVAIAFAPDATRIIVQLELALVGVVTVLAAVGVLRRAAPLAPPCLLDRVPRAAARTSRPLPLDLVRISRRFAAADASAADARRVLAPLVATIAADRLRSGAHTEIDADFVYRALPSPVPDALALVLDPALAALDTRELPGLDADGCEALVRALEQL